MRIPSKTQKSDNSNATNQYSKLVETTAGLSKSKETYTASSWRKDRKKSSSGSSSKLNEDDDPFFNDDDDFDDDFDDNDGILGMEFGLLSAKKSKRKSKHFSTRRVNKNNCIIEQICGQTAAIRQKLKGR